MKAPDTDLGSQQVYLASADYDLRVSNLADFIYHKLPVKHGTLLDVGAGNGLLIKFFKAKGFTSSGIELSSELVEKMKSDPYLQGVTVSTGDITQVKGNESYDVVICNDVIEHIENDNLALQNLWTFVKKNGLLVVSVPAHSFLYGKRDRSWGHYRRYDKTVLLDRIKNLQGRITFCTYWNTIGFFIYFIFERLLKKPINETVRYSSSPVSKLIRSILDMLFKVEALSGGTPLGLTLVVGVKKT